MLRHIKRCETHLLEDDPVRPHIPSEIKLSAGREVFVWDENGKPEAIVCVSFTERVAITEEDLYNNYIGETSVAMLYTIWSYSPRAGRKLVRSAFEELSRRCSRVVTLSPKTEMARRFHISNGAVELQENIETINYEYKL